MLSTVQYLGRYIDNSLGLSWAKKGILVRVTRSYGACSAYAVSELRRIRVSGLQRRAGRMVG